MGTSYLTAFAMMLILSASGALCADSDQGARKEDGPEKVYTILPLGDSITEGGGTFSVYRYPLWEKLFAGGYRAEFVGSKNAATRIGPMAHEGYGGKNAEFLAQNIEKFYADHPADIVLLHCGHNHTIDERPIPGILSATESIIVKVHAQRKDAVVLVAQVIPSGKLPKYSYIPELNIELAKLVARLKGEGHEVRLVNQEEGFDWKTDTIDDHVHPNAVGAAKMAGKWYEALVQVLPQPRQTFAPELITYKQASGLDLKLHIFKPRASKADAVKPAAQAARPAIVFFFGGGWTHGTPLQYYREAAWFSSRGMVAICADYRVATTAKTTPIESLQDARAAIRWVRQHAGELGVDPSRIAAAGASAGGHLAAATAAAKGFDDPREDAGISAKPDALLLWYPVIDNGPGGYGYERVKDKYKDFSPLHALGAGFPPTVVFLGTKDALIPVATGQAFKKRIEELGGRCDLHLYEGAGHPIYSYRAAETAASRQILKQADEFLVSLKYLEAVK